MSANKKERQKKTETMKDQKKKHENKGGKPTAGEQLSKTRKSLRDGKGFGDRE